MEERETAVCRNCGIELIGKPYSYGGDARHPATGNVCKINHYGGFVCSEECDEEATSKQQTSVDAHNDLLGYYS